MKIKYVKRIRPAQKNLTVLTSLGVVMFEDLGQVKDLDPMLASACLGKFPGCLEAVAEEQAKESQKEFLEKKAADLEAKAEKAEKEVKELSKKSKQVKPEKNK